MAVRFQDEAFPILKEYLYYQQTIRQKSIKTVDEYFLDLRTFFRFMKVYRKQVPEDADFQSITIDDIDLAFVETISLNDAYEYMNYLQRERGNNAAARARKCSSLKGFFKFITQKNIISKKIPLRSLKFQKRKKLSPSISRSNKASSCLTPSRASTASATTPLSPSSSTAVCAFRRWRG